MGQLDEILRIFAAVPEGGIIEWNKRVGLACVKEGLAVVLIQPGGKEPACTLNAAETKRADADALAAGRKRHECGFKHAITEARQFTHKRIKELLDNGCNLAIAPGVGSTAIIVVDVDTEAELAAFLADQAKEENLPAGHTMPLTVTSPGSWAKDRNGFVMDGGEHVWAHSGGGHFWFVTAQPLPEQGPGKYRAPSGWTAMFRDCYVLVPPSVRAEGAYRATGAAHSAPGWLLDRIAAAATARKETWRSGDLRGSEALDEWSAEHSGSEIAASHGYLPYSHDLCGCPTWTRPGDASHLKSITTCEVGCSRFDTSLGWGPVHIWSDAIEGFTGGETITPLQFLARLDFEGDTRAAMADQGIPTTPLPAEASEDPQDAALFEIMGAPDLPKAPGRPPRP
jgi:hypothetical protein